MAVALSRYALGSNLTTDGPPTAAATRSRLAPLIITIGTGGIIVLALGIIVIVSLSDNPAITDKLDTILLSIFSAVLPVFATWVGTILAFYYSTENFKQASEAALGAMRSSGVGAAEEVGKSARLIPYDKIARIDLKTGDEAEDVSMEKINGLFNPPATRIIIFTDKKRPVFIIWQKLVAANDQKVKDYLKREANRADAQRFKFIPATATVEEARSMLNVYRVSDLFVNDSGSAEEPVQGWVTDDALKL